MPLLSRDLVRRLANVSGFGRRGSSARPSGYDELSTVRCFDVSASAVEDVERSREGDCAEFYAPDGRLIWEASSQPASEEGNAPWSR